MPAPANRSPCDGAPTSPASRFPDGSAKLRPNADIEALRRAARRAEVLAPDVSKWSVGMHIHHLCLAMEGVCESLLASEPPTPPARRSLLTAAVFLSGRIPRGRARSPDPVIPTPGISGEALSSMLDASAAQLNAAAVAHPQQWFRHFAFGVLDRDQTLKFIRIHNRHHLRIIDDILKSADDGNRKEGP